jgi:nitrate reductase cytochrome c-type subunit
MRIVAAVLALVLVVSPVYAQNAGGMGGRAGGKGRASQNSEQQKADQQKKKAAEDAYKSGLKMIPDAKEKYDPWKNTR